MIGDDEEIKLSFSLKAISSHLSAQSGNGPSGYRIGLKVSKLIHPSPSDTWNRLLGSVSLTWSTYRFSDLS